MLIDVVEVRALGEQRLWLRFENGVTGEIDLARLIRFDGVFSPLVDAAVFACVRVDPELGTIRWPNGADIAPETLYEGLIRREAGH